MIERYNNRGVEDLDRKEFCQKPWPHETNPYACIMQQKHDGSSTPYPSLLQSVLR